jgi:hypothetical protein
MQTNIEKYDNCVRNPNNSTGCNSNGISPECNTTTSSTIPPNCVCNPGSKGWMQVSNPIISNVTIYGCK